jgi:hypothetical protein
VRSHYIDRRQACASWGESECGTIAIFDSMVSNNIEDVRLIVLRVSCLTGWSRLRRDSLRAE